MDETRSPAIHWFTSDLRLTDNLPLAAAASHGPVACVFVLDAESLRRAAGAPRRVAFLTACLEALDRDVAARGSRLLILRGDPAEEIPRLAATLGARVLTYSRNYEPAARAREGRVEGALQKAGVTVRSGHAGTVHPPGQVLTGSGSPYLVYGPFARAWGAVPLPRRAAAPRQFVPESALRNVRTAGLPPRRDDLVLPAAGEAAGRRRLATFVRTGLAGYADRRDFPGLDATSRLSYHFRFGTLSPAEACRSVRAAMARHPRRKRGAQVWLREMAWRDFFAHLLHAFPRLAREPFRPLPVRWRVDDEGFRRWCEGTTGYPIVDAGMRELVTTGWMHNRVRMITASFLTRHLLLDWREGERHFMAMLLDGQLSQNNGNWQWVAGTGADAQPPYRIFNPVRQGTRFDPDATYVRTWVPELARVPPRHVQAPWTLTRGERRALCPDYPPPVVDLDEARGRAVAALERAISRRR